MVKRKKDPMQLPEDYDTPFSEPRGQEDVLQSDHPETDANIDPHELYDEGLAAASEVDLPNPEQTVIGYQPPKSQKRKKRRSSKAADSE